MYKIKNITEENILFVDTEGNKTMIEPGKEIESKLPAVFGYDKKLQISGSGDEEKVKSKPQEENKKPEEVK